MEVKKKQNKEFDVVITLSQKEARTLYEDLEYVNNQFNLWKKLKGELEA